MIPAPVLADLLAGLTEAELAELEAEQYANLPAGMVDQYRAATRDAHRVLATQGRVIETTPARLPDPVLVSILDTLQTWAAGSARLCLHAPAPERPRPVWAAAWKPGLIVCAACTHLLRLPRGSAADRTCDLCGHVVAGLDHGEGIHANTTTYGPLSFMYGACPDCHKEMTA